MEYMKDDNAIVEDSTSDTVFIRISVHELKNQKCLQFRLNDTVWQAKQRIITAFAKDLCDALNFGLYLPPVNGRAGKFLAEERYLREYPLQGPIGFLEFKYKRRVYKLNNINIRKLRRLHSKSCLRQFLEQVRNGNVGKIVKVTNKGLDPNFHDQDSGETPLTVAVTLSKDRTKKVIIALVGGGAHIDFHNRSGLTAVHRAAIVGNVEAIKTLLDLGASPDQKDGSGFTALYYSVSNNTDLLCTEMLLQEKATIGTHDELGWSEVHQVCRYGRRQHLELLLHYGAEMDVQNASGNTPLHICAAYSQDDCAHVLLVRGVNRSILNFSSQTAFQLAILAKSVGVAELLMSFDDKNIVPIKEMPSYSDRRKGSMTPSMRALLRSRSSPRLHFDSHGSLDGRSVFNSSLSISTMHDFMPSPKDVELFVEDTSSPSLYSCTVPSICSEPETIDRVSIQEPGGGGGQANCSGRASRMDGLLRYKAKSMMDLRMEGEDAVPYGTNTLATMIRPETNDTPRVVILRRMPDGYGFVLRGAKSRTHLGDLNFTPTPEVPALQYLESVDKGSSADKSRLLAGDFLLEINGESVTRASHERVVQLIRSSGDILRMKVLSVGGAGSSIATNQRPASPDWYHRCATARSYQGSTGKRPAPTPPHRDPATSLSYSRATSKSVSDVFTEIDHLDQMIAGFDQQPSSSIRSHSMLNVDCVGVTGCENKVASVRAARAMKRMSVCDVGGDAGRGLLASSFIRNADHAPKMSPAEMRINKYYKKGNPAGSQHRPQSVVGLVGAYAPTGVRPAANGGGPDAGEISSTRWRTPALGQPLASNNSADEADVVGTGCDVATSSAHKNSPVKDCADRAEVVCIDTGRASMSKVVDIAEESMRAAGNITSFHSGTKSRLRDDPPGPLRPVELPGSSYSSSGYSGDHAEPASHYRSSCVSFAEDHVHDSASAFLRKHPEARLIVTSDIYVDSTDNGVSHQSAARGVAPYEPEPDYGSDSGDDVTSSTLATSHFTTTSSYEHSWRGDAVSTDRYQPATCNAVISSAGLPCNIARDGNGAPVSLTSVTGLSNVHVNPPTEVQARAAVDRSEHMRSDDLYHRSPPPDHPPPPPPASMTGVHAQKYRYASVLHQDSQQPAGAQCEPGESSLPPAPVISSADILEAVLTRKKRIEENGVQMKQLSGSSPVPRLLDRNIEALKAAVERRRRCLEGNSTTPVEDIEARLGKMHTLRSPSGVETKLKIPGKEWVGRQSNGIHGSTTSNSAGGGGDENSVCGNVNDSSSRNEAHLSLLDCMSSKPGSDCAQSGSTPSEGDPVTNRSVSALSKIFESPGWSNDNSACQKTETPPARDFPTATSSSDASMILVGKSSADKLQHTSVPVTHSDTLTNHSVTEVVVKRLPAGKHCAASGKDSTTLVSHRSTAVQSLATTGNTSLADSSCPANGVSRTTDSQPPSTGVAPSLRYPVATLARKKPKEIMSHNASVKPPVSCPSVKKPAERYNAKGGSENGGLPVTRNSAITSSPVGVLCPVSASCPAETSSPQHVAATPLSRSDQLKSDDLLVKAEKARLAYLHKVSSSSPMKVGVSRADNTSSSSQSGLICTTTLPVSTRPSRNVDSSIMVSRLNSVNMLSAASAKTDSAVVDNAKCTRAKLLYEPFGGRQSSTTGESNGSHVDQIHGDTLDGDDGLGGDGVSLDLRQLSIEIIPPPPSFRMTRMNGTKSSLDDSSSLVSSISSLSTLSSEPGESVQAGSFGQPADDVLTLCPPRGYDSLNVMTTSVPVIDSCIPPPDQFSGDSHIQELAKKAFLRNPVEKWKCADVFDWLESLGMGQYKDSFARLSVDGRRLVSLERNDYIELGVLEVSHRIDLQRSIMRLIINGETLI